MQKKHGTVGSLLRQHDRIIMIVYSYSYQLQLHFGLTNTVGDPVEWNKYIRGGRMPPKTNGAVRAECGLKIR